MQQTPAHDEHNPDLLKIIPTSCRSLIEVGCSAGALAREVKKLIPACNYFGIDIDETYIGLARRYCDQAMAFDIEQAEDHFFAAQSDRDCWIFGDTLEHLVDPWRLLRRIREVLPAHGCVVACIPNAQHWSVIAKLSIGDFRYQDSGLFDKTHLRWFTRQTIIELFTGAGFVISEGFPRIFNEPSREKLIPIIGELAKACGVDAKISINDALPLQYVIRAVPAQEHGSTSK